MQCDTWYSIILFINTSDKEFKSEEYLSPHQNMIHLLTMIIVVWSVNDTLIETILSIRIGLPVPLVPLRAYSMYSCPLAHPQGMFTPTHRSIHYLYGFILKVLSAYIRYWGRLQGWTGYPVSRVQVLDTTQQGEVWRAVFQFFQLWLWVYILCRLVKSVKPASPLCHSKD